jgi:hypothetical protein
MNHRNHRRWPSDPPSCLLLSLSLAVAELMLTLVLSIVNVPLPSIRGALGASAA